MKGMFLRLFFVFACLIFGGTRAIAVAPHTNLQFTTEGMYALPKETAGVFVFKQADSKNAEAFLKEWREVIHLFRPSGKEKYRDEEVLMLLDLLGVDAKDLAATRDLTFIAGLSGDEKAFGLYLKHATLNVDKIKEFFKKEFTSQVLRTITFEDLYFILGKRQTVVMKHHQKDVLHVAGVSRRDELEVGFTPTGIFKRAVDAHVDVVTFTFAIEFPREKKNDSSPRCALFKVYNRGLSLIGRLEMEFASEALAKKCLESWEKEKEKIQRQYPSEALQQMLSSLKITASGKKLIFMTKEVSAFECYRIVTELELRKLFIR